MRCIPRCVNDFKKEHETHFNDDHYGKENKNWWSCHMMVLVSRALICLPFQDPRATRFFKNILLMIRLTDKIFSFASWN